MKTQYLIIYFATFLLASCAGIDESNLKLYPSKLYLGVSGYNLKELYDLGEDKLTWDIYVSKSGYFDQAAEVELLYDPTILTEYREATQNGLDFEVLPENLGTLELKKLVFAANETLAGTQLIFNMTSLRQNIPADEDVRYVYPIRIKSLTENVAVNDNKDYLLLAIQLRTPRANLRGKGGEIEVKCDPFRKINMDKIIIPLIMDLPFDNKDMELSFTYKADPDLLVSYNQANGTNYELFQGNYTTPELKIKAGQVSGIAEIEANPSSLQPLRDGSSCLLPIRITGCSNPAIKIQEGSVTYLKITASPQWSVTWTETIGNETGISTATGNVNTVKLYNRQAFIAAGVGDQLAKDAMNAMTDDDAIICPGWGGTYFDQTIIAIKVTDEDYGGGKKKVELLFGWVGDLWWGTVSTNNNSWFDPATWTIHVEYSGTYSWGTFSVNRDFTNPVF
jgi:hypothetical protein